MTENQGQYAPPPPATSQPADQATAVQAPDPVPVPETAPPAPAPAAAPQAAPPAASAPTEIPAADTPAPVPQPGGVLTADGTHPSVLVRLRDVVAHVENFFARHPELRALESDLKSGVATIERHGTGSIS